MALKPNLRLATFNVLGYCKIEMINGKQILRGVKVFTNIVELFERAGFNVSLVPVDGVTTGTADENGTYDGLYGAVQSGKADTAFLAAPLRLSESIGQYTPIIMDAANLIATKREPMQVFEGTLFDSLTTFGTLNNLLLGTIVALVLIFLSILVSKNASWKFFALLMTENFVHFRPMSLQLTSMVALLIIRALFGSAYSTDVAIAIPSKVINSLEDLAKSTLLPTWFEGDPVYLEFKQGVTKAHADVFNMGPKNRTQALSMLQIQTDCSKLFKTNSFLFSEFLTSTITKYVCKYKSPQISSGDYRMFISKPFSRTDFAYVYSQNTSALTTNKLKKYANQVLEQSLIGDTFKTASDEYIAPSPQCESEISKGVDAVAATNTVKTKLMPLWQTICGLTAAMVVLFVESWFAVVTFIYSARRYFWL